LVLLAGRPFCASWAAALLKSAYVTYRRSSGRFQKSGPVDRAGPMVTLVRFSCEPLLGLRPEKPISVRNFRFLV